MTKDIFLRGQKSGVLCSTKYAENQQVTEVIHNFVHSFDELCIIFFISLPYTVKPKIGGRSPDRTRDLPRHFHAIRPDENKKILPPERKAGNLFVPSPVKRAKIDEGL